MILLAIDPSTTSTGWAMFEDDKLVRKGCIKGSGGTPIERAANVARGIEDKINLYHPTHIISEYPHKGGPGMKSKTITILFHLCGAIHGLAIAYDLDVEFIEPIKWKGNIPKKIHQPRIIKRVKKRYDIDISEENNDVIDAVGIGDWFLFGR